jgi:hypothetical protein
MALKTNNPSNIIGLNIGGQLYSTSRSTLLRYSDSILSKMLVHECLVGKDDQDNFFFDRDGSIFRPILNFLRTGKLSLPNKFEEFKLLLEEADFYGLPQLKEETSKAKQQTTKIYEVVQLRVCPSFGAEGTFKIIGMEDTLRSIFPDFGQSFGATMKSNSPAVGVVYLDVTIGREARLEIPQRVPVSCLTRMLLMNGFRCISVVVDNFRNVWFFERAVSYR